MLRRDAVRSSCSVRLCVRRVSAVVAVAVGAGGEVLVEVEVVYAVV
jgi:hypothetical protein